MPEEHKKGDSEDDDGIQLAGGKKAKLHTGQAHPAGDINISKEMRETSIWKTITNEKNVKDLP